MRELLWRFPSGNTVKADQTDFGPSEWINKASNRDIHPISCGNQWRNHQNPCPRYTRWRMFLLHRSCQFFAIARSCRVIHSGQQVKATLAKDVAPQRHTTLLVFVPEWEVKTAQ